MVIMQTALSLVQSKISLFCKQLNESDFEAMTARRHQVVG